MSKPLIDAWSRLRQLDAHLISRTLEGGSFPAVVSNNWRGPASEANSSRPTQA
jgi:hypothetical protein